MRQKNIYELPVQKTTVPENQASPKKIEKNERIVLFLIIAFLLLGVGIFIYRNNIIPRQSAKPQSSETNSSQPSIIQSGDGTSTVTSTPITQLGDNKYSISFVVNISGYKVYQKNGFDFLSFPEGHQDYSDGFPVIPYLEFYSLPWPTISEETSIATLRVVDSHSSSIGKLNIPIAEVKPFSAGGLSYTTETDIDYSYPTELVKTEETLNKMILYAIPIQYNPKTHEVTFYDELNIEVVYETPTPIFISNVSLDNHTYTPGEQIMISADIYNIGAQNSSVSPTLSILNKFGQEVATWSAALFTIPGGGSYSLSTSWGEVLEPDSYNLVLKLLDGSTVLTSAAESFGVLAGY